MATYANISPLSVAEGTVYASDVVLTTTEADLYNGATVPNQDPVPILYSQAIQAVVKLVVYGAPASNSTYVVMQTDLGNSVWVDVAWCMYTNTQAQGVFVLSGGIAGNNAFQQTRNANSPPTPQASGSNAMVLGSRVRFVGRTALGGGSSYAAGGFAGVKATIWYKLLGLR